MSKYPNSIAFSKALMESFMEGEPFLKIGYPKSNIPGFDLEGLELIDFMNKTSKSNPGMVNYYRLGDTGYWEMRRT
jgi:hypothetical protein